MGLFRVIREAFRTPPLERSGVELDKTGGLLKRFLPYLLPWKKYGILAGIFMMIAVILQLPMPLVTRYVIDNVFTKSNVRILNWIVIGLAGLLVFRFISSLISRYLLTRFRQNVLKRIQTDLFEHVEYLSLAFHDDMKVGYLMSRVGNDPQNLRALLAETFFIFLRSSLTFVIGVGILFYLHWKLALISVITLPFFVYTICYFSPRVRRISADSQEKIGRVFDSMGESLAGIRVTKSYCMEEHLSDNFNGRLGEAFDVKLQHEMISSVYTSVAAFIAGIGPLILLSYGGREVMNGNLTLGSFVAFNGYIGYLYGPVRTLMGLNSRVQSAMASLKRVFDIFDIPTEDEIGRNAELIEELTEVEGRITFDHVSFSYDGRKQAISDITFEVRPGERIALVGRSGAGKTTIVNMIMKFYNPQEGSVLIDNMDVVNVKARALREHIGVVMQNPYLFAGSIWDNLRFARRDATEEEVVEAARAAHAHHFIMKLPDQYDTDVGQLGVKLSGGQVKRLAIARAMLKDPQILILDEATSEVDSESERHIREASESLLKGKTTFIIAHRFASIREVDRIFVIDNGEIIDEGTHDYLYTASDIYRMLYDEQAGISS